MHAGLVMEDGKGSLIWCGFECLKYVQEKGSSNFEISPGRLRQWNGTAEKSG